VKFDFTKSYVMVSINFLVSNVFDRSSSSCDNFITAIVRNLLIFTPAIASEWLGRDSDKFKTSYRVFDKNITRDLYLFKFTKIKR